MSKAVTTAQRALLVRTAGRLSTNFALQKRAAGRQTPSLIGHFRRSSRKRERKDDKQQSVQISLSNLMIAPTIAALRTIAYVVLITKFER
jgi:hypothetical protein